MEFILSSSESFMPSPARVFILTVFFFIIVFASFSSTPCRIIFRMFSSLCTSSLVMLEAGLVPLKKRLSGERRLPWNLAQMLSRW